MAAQDKRKYAAPAAACAADLLLALSRAGAPLSVADLARETGHTRSLVCRVVRELEERGFLGRMPTGRYWLGLSAVELGGAFSASVPLLDSVRALLRELADATGETANLGILRGDEVLYLAREEGARSVFAVSHVGRLLPANCVALGKALLAELSDDDVRALLAPRTGRPGGALRGLTAESITSVDELLEELARVRKQGFAEEHSEAVPGRCCAAVPVRLGPSPSDRTALSVSMDEERYAEEGPAILARLGEVRDRVEREVAGRAAMGEPASLGGGLVPGLP